MRPLLAKDNHSSNNAAQVEINKQYLRDLRAQQAADQAAKDAQKNGGGNGQG